MLPIFFPFTYMSEPTAAALSALFSRAALYRPSDVPLPETLQRQADAGLLEIRTPLQGNEERLNRAVADYRAWAERHGGSPLAFFQSQHGQIPFFEDASLSRIRSQIKQWTKAEPTGETTDPVFAARLFLSVAQAFDREQCEINRSFAGLRDLEVSLLKSIHGESDAGSLAMAPPVEDLGAHMTDRRLWAWSCLWAADTEPSPLLVTDSREVFDATMDPLFDNPHLDRFDMVWPLGPVDRERQDVLARFLTALSREKTGPAAAPTSEGPGEDGRQMILHLFRIRGMRPLDVVSKAAGIDASTAADAEKENRPANTVVACLDFSG